MSNLTTTKLLSVYEQQAPRTRALTGLLRTAPENFHNSEDVEKDIIRNEEEIATVVTSVNSRGNKNEATVYTNKKFTPPIFDEEVSVNSFDMNHRQPGQTPFTDPRFRANAGSQLLRSAKKVEEKIQRAIEEMASQVFQTGKLVLNDQAGVQRFTMDFSPKASHFPQVAVSWSNPASKPLLDLDSLANVIRDDGLVDSNRVIMGDLAFENFINNSTVKERLDNRRMQLGEVAPKMRGNGAVFQAFVWQGNYRYEIWTYNGRYKHPVTGVSTRYVGQNNVIMLSSESTVVDLTMGSIPLIVAPDPRVRAFIPGSLGSAQRGMKLSVNAWISENNKTISMEVGTRPLVIPTGIDTFGTLNTVQP